MEVEVREEASPGQHSETSTGPLVNNSSAFPRAETPVVVVRVEEVLLVVLVLMIWVAAIALFFNRWGKIRMLEPYQPKFHQQAHRPSCPLAPLSPPIPTQVNNNLPIRNQKPISRMSFSKYNVNAMTDPLSALPSPIIRRPRQNSVFAGSPAMAIFNPPRRVKSAMDIQHMVFNEHSPTSLSGSVIPILNRDRRPSITIERPPLRNFPPLVPTLHVMPNRGRRSSCFVERPTRHHRNFISFEQPTLLNDRKLSMTYEPSTSSSCHHQHHQTISFESPSTSSYSEKKTVAAAAEASTSTTTTVIIETPPREPTAFPKISRSFEQPKIEKPKPLDRMATSLDVCMEITVDNRRPSIPEEESVYISLDETKITAPLLEGLKSSDV